MSELSAADFDEGALIRELVDRGGLSEFVKQFWGECVPQTLAWNWHLDAIAEYLQAVTVGQIKRLVINIPPGTGKSLNCGVFWPAYLWTLDPTIQIICGSFDQTLLNGQSEKLIAILRSDRYRSAYPWVSLVNDKSPALREFKLSAGGYRFNTSPEGKGTGRHGDGAIVDDPMKPLDAQMQRKPAFTKIDNWFDGTLQTRIRKWLVCVMQRVHTDDLAGRCLAEGYESLILPMRQTRRVMWQPPEWVTERARDPRTEVGELLWPGLFPEEIDESDPWQFKNFFVG